MSYNGSGTFLINTAGQPVVSGTVISSTAFNALTADLATGLSTAITKDGQTTVTANIPMSTYRFTGLGAGVAATDSANLSQVQSTVSKLLTAVTGADTITASAAPTLTAYATGQMFYFVAAGDNTTTVTLNIDGLGAKAVTRDGSVALAASDIKSGEVVVVVYDGTRFQVVSQLNSAGNATFANVSITSALNVGGVATFTANPVLNGGTANGVLYLNGSKAATSGSALVFDGTNLGIGTSSPITKLDVRSDAAVVTTSGYAGWHFNALPASATARAATIRKNYDSPFDFNIYASTGTSGNSAATIFYRDASNESARFDTSGNLGIGTNVPGYRLDVRGANGVGLQIYETSTGNNNRTIIAQDGTVSRFTSTYSIGSGSFAWNIGNSEVARIDLNGNLGIGTSSPATKLHVNTATAGYGITVAASSQTSNTFQFGIDSSSNLAIYDTNAAAQRLVLSSSGNLGIGTSSPGARLHSKSSIAENTIIEGTTARGSGSVYAAFYDPTGRKGYFGYGSGLNDGFFVANEMNAALIFQTNATTRASITADGNIVAGGSVALATNATNGFLYVPTCAGTPTGTPTAITGMAPIVVNTTNNKLYFYSGGAWRDAGP